VKSTNSLLNYVCHSAESDAYYVANELVKRGYDVNLYWPLHVAVINKYE
jgi:hypothetical protein